jgi:glutathione S-transferase
VPVLYEYDNEDLDEGKPSFVLYESVAINSYLADRYADGSTAKLVPAAGTRERALYDQTVCCILSELDSQGLWIHRKHEALSQYFGKIPEAVEHAHTQFNRMNAQLAAQLNPYLLGEDFTAADILYVHCLDWSKSIGWHKGWPENVVAYRETCHQRPAFQRAKALRDAEKAKRDKEVEETAENDGSNL